MNEATTLLDESLQRLARTGPEFGGGLSNHAPMAVEALLHLGRPEEIEGWVDRYLPRFPAAVAALAPAVDPSAQLAELGRYFARIFLTHGRRKPISFLHAVTAPVAARSVLPLLPAELATPTHDALWRLAAGLYAAHAGTVDIEPAPAGAPPSPEEIADRAIESGDEHAIKLAEACLREHAESPDPLLLHAAARGSELLIG